jgi:DNA-binding NarL/FixJ family response regulator
MQEALSVGAWGYVVKENVGGELLAAAKTVISGKKWVNST